MKMIINRVNSPIIQGHDYKFCSFNFHLNYKKTTTNMSSRKTRQRNRKIRDRHPKVTLKELMDKGEVSVDDFQELNLVGGLTGRKKNDWWKNLEKS